MWEGEGTRTEETEGTEKGWCIGESLNVVVHRRIDTKVLLDRSGEWSAT
jgi:hypothetical protein